jgi:hexosaminidase
MTDTTPAGAAGLPNAPGAPGLSFEARIDGDQIRCRIGSDRLLASPVWCFSLLAPPRVVSGGTLIRDLAGYAEVQLPDLRPGEPREVVLAHHGGHRPANRAWLPQGGYLRLEDDATLPLPRLPSGVREVAAAPGPALGEALPLVPQPSRWAPAAGVLAARGLRLPEDEALAAVAALGERTGLGPLSDPAGPPLRERADATLPPEGYVLEVAETEVTLRAGDRAGRFNAAVTLLALMAQGPLPLGRLEDAPRFSWRGQHLDCARHFFEVDTILRLLDLMALLKLNRFHWHGSDDEAFRWEVDCAPDLWRRTAFRGEGCLLPGVFGGGVRSGGSYSKADVARVIAHARTLGIEVMPEIEVPAHAYGMIAAMPSLRDPEDKGAEHSVQGYPRNVVNPAMGATWDLLLPLAAEVASMFPHSLLHLGCDELPEGTWSGSPAVDGLKDTQGLRTTEDVQGWTIARLAAHVVGLGVRPAAWEEASRGSQGGIGHGALIFSWTGQGPGIAAARMGHDVVMCPAQNAYLDMAHSADPDDWGASWAAFIGLEDTVGWRVVPREAEDVADRIVGVQGTFWGEFTTEDREMEPLLAPRILGIACKAWEAEGRTDGARLRALAEAWGPLLDRMGWRRHRGA